jgi:outer membrane protein assembly factor BamB
MHLEEQQSLPATPASPALPQSPRPFRLWLPLSAVGLYWTFMFLSHWLEFTTFMRFLPRLIAGVLLTLLLVGWWWASRRISLRNRLIGFLLVVGDGIIANFLCDPSVGGIGLLMGALPAVLTLGALWMLATQRAGPALQWRGMVVVISLAWAFLLCVRAEGIWGDLRPHFQWRWSESAEDRNRAARAKEAADRAKSQVNAAHEGSINLAVAPGDWPGFRGPFGDSKVVGVTIRTDWNGSPPRQVWKRPIGPAWSSVVVIGGRLFTQAQHDDKEAVVCYDAATGKELWAHEEPIRFSENTAGAGPRATPCVADGRVFAVGATGVLVCVDAATGKLLWSQDIKGPSGATVPMWGFSNSPLAVGDLVVVFAGGKGPDNLLAYRAASGDLAWSAAVGESSYSSPQLGKLAETPQVLMLTNRGLSAVDPTTGKVLWEHAAPLPPAAPRSLQPQVLGESSVLIASEDDLGLARIDVKREAGTWTATQRWATKKFQPAFNDFVVLGGHAYGFDGRIFACLDLDKGSRRWRDGRFGQGQVLLLPDQGLLLVISEEGQAILLKANPERLEEIGRFPAVEGKTWNHPVIAHGRLFVRNGEWFACYDLGANSSR